MRSVFAPFSSSRRVRSVIAALSLSACRTGAPTAEPAATPALDPATRAAREALANERTLDIRTIAASAIAVPALTVRTSDSTLAPLGYGLADMLLTDLARSSQVTIVERGRMNALLREMQLVEAGLVDTAYAPRVGRLLGARRLVVGALVDRGGGELGVETRLINTVDGSISGTVSARAPLSAIFDAEKALTYRIFQELGVTLTPAERNAIEQRPTANITAFLAYSRGVRDEAFGQYASAATNFQAAVRADPSFAPAKARLENVQAAQQTSQAQANAPEVKAEEPKAPEPPKVVAAAPATTTTTSGGAPSSGSAGGAATLAAGTINPSPAGTIGTSSGSGTTTSSTQQQQQQDRGAQAQRQPVIATVIINIKQLP